VPVLSLSKILLELFRCAYHLRGGGGGISIEGRGSVSALKYIRECKEARRTPENRFCRPHAAKRLPTAFSADGDSWLEPCSRLSWPGGGRVTFTLWSPSAR